MLLQVGKVLIILGFIILLLGGGLYLIGKFDLPFGRLPGDIRIVRGNLTCLIPLATSIVISILLTVILNLLARWINQ